MYHVINDEINLNFDIRKGKKCKTIRSTNSYMYQESLSGLLTADRWKKRTLMS